jgi:hypothetical protein
MITHHRNLPLFTEELELPRRSAYVSTLCGHLRSRSILLIPDSRLIKHKNNFLFYCRGTFLGSASYIFSILKSRRVVITDLSLVANYKDNSMPCQFISMVSGKSTLCALLIILENITTIFLPGPLKLVVVVLK